MKTRVISSSHLRHTMRFDGSYHNAEMNIYGDAIGEHPHYVLSDLCSNIFTSGRNKRVYTSREFGNPFLSNSDVVAADPLMCCNYSSKKYGTDEAAMLKGGMILTGRVGAIGQTAYVPKYWENYNAMGSDNIIRIVPKTDVKGGYIYAYLTSKVGTLALWKLATGGVQPFVTDSMVRNLLIPKFPEEFQKEVDDLVQESARLREEATDALNQAVTHFNEFFVHRQLKPKNIDYISIEEIRSKYFRLDSQFQIGKKYHQPSKNGIPTISLNEIASAIFITGRGKRNYVDLNGVPFISSSDMLLANPVKYAKQISKNTKGIENLIISEGDILVSRSGSVGNLAFIGKELSGITASDHAMRLRINKDKMAPEYVFAYLNSQNGKEAIAYLPYGSVIITLGEEYLGDVLLPLLSKGQMEDIVSLVKTYADCTDKAIRA